MVLMYPCFLTMFVLLSIHVLGIAKSSPGFGPAAVKSQLRNDFSHFVLGDAIFLGCFHVVFQRTVSNALGDEGRHGDDAPFFEGQDIVLAPHFTKEDVVIITGKIGGKVPQLLPPCGLDNFNGFFRLIISCIHGKCISCSQKSYPGQGDEPGC